MTFSWRFVPDAPSQDQDGHPLPPGFASQSDAESWIGETWRWLAAEGVGSAALERDGEQLYRLPLTE